MIRYLVLHFQNRTKSTETREPPWIAQTLTTEEVKGIFQKKFCLRFHFFKSVVFFGLFFLLPRQNLQQRG